MGYYTTFTGEILISPVPTEEQLKKLAKIDEEHGKHFGYYSNEYLCREQIAQMCDFCRREGLTMNGTIHGEGEENDDIWEIRIKDNQIATITLVKDTDLI